MSAISIAIERGTALLRAAQCRFIVVTEQGETIRHGDLQLAEPKPESRRRKAEHRPVGALTNHLAPFLTALEPGACVTIPFGPFEAETKTLAKAVSAWCSRTWGNKSSIVHLAADGVEVLRVA